MKKLFVLAALFMSLSAYAQDPVTKYLEGRFGGPDSQTFIPKGYHALGIKGGYRSFGAVGDDNTNAGYALLSILNIGNGQLRVWNVSPSYSIFIADDLSLGVSLNYNGYAADTDLRLDFRDILKTTDEALNFTISNRSMRHHAGGLSVNIRKYMPLFGSKHFAVFGEGRLEGSYGATTNAPRGDNKDYNRERISQTYGVALKAGGGLAVKMGDNAITISIPLFGLGYNYTTQDKTTTQSIKDETTGQVVIEQVKSKTHLSTFNAARNLDLLGVQFGFTRYIGPKTKKK